MERLSVFIDSFDGNSDVWGNLITNFNYFWSKCPYKRYLVSNNKEYVADNLEVIKTGDEIDWFSTTLEALKRIDSKYIWFFLDDYYLSKFIQEEDIEEILDYMDKESLYFYRMSLRGDLDRSAKRQPITSDFVYAINLQPAIWNRTKFVEILEDLHKKGFRTPWEFEKHFINYFESLGSREQISGIMYDTRDLMGYKNAIIQGKWVGHVIKFFKKRYGIVINPGERDIMPLSTELFDYIKRKGHSIISYRTRSRIKRILNKVGFKFMTH